MKNNPVSIDEKHSSLWIGLNEPVTMDNYSIIETHCLQQIKQFRNTYIVLDLSQVTMLYSSGVGLVVRINSFVKSIDKTLVCVNCASKVSEGFQLLGLDKILSFCSTEEDFIRLVNK